MKSVILSLIVAFSAPALACEQHQDQAKKAAESALPGKSLYHLDSAWTDQDGRSQRLPSLAGRPRLVAMVFTRCQTACPLLVSDLRGLESRLSDEERNRLSVDLFSFDAGRETPATMKAFAAKYRLDEKRWSVRSGTDGTVAELAAALGVQYKKLDSGDFIHANVVFLLDANGEVIAKKEGLGQDDASFLEGIRRAVGTP